MTSPALTFIDWLFRKQKDKIDEEHKKYKILVSFKTSEMGRKLLLIANCFVNKRQAKSEVSLLHLSEGSLLYQNNLGEEEDEIFEPVLKEAKRLHQPVSSSFKISSNPHVDLAKTANNDDYNLLLIGYRGSIFSDNVLGRILGFSSRIINVPNNILSRLGGFRRWAKTFNIPAIDESTRTIISKSDMPVGTFIDRGLLDIKNVFFLVWDEDDVFIGEFMTRMFENSNIRVTLWDMVSLADTSIDFVNSIKEIKTANPYLFQLWNNNIPMDGDIIGRHDLLILSLNSWKALHAEEPEWLKEIPSTLIISNLY